MLAAVVARARQRVAQERRPVVLAQQQVAAVVAALRRTRWPHASR